MALIHLTTENFDKLTSGIKPVLIDFYANWCGPCKMLSPLIEHLAEIDKDIVDVYKLNVDDESMLASRFSVMSIPTLIVLKGGQIFARSVGFKDSIDEIRKLYR